MSEESTTKKEWKKPEIVDLDLDKTSSGASPGAVENFTSHS
jgi:hypothetical protein